MNQLDEIITKLHDYGFLLNNQLNSHLSKYLKHSSKPKHTKHSASLDKSKINLYLNNLNNLNDKLYLESEKFCNFTLDNNKLIRVPDIVILSKLKCNSTLLKILNDSSNDDTNDTNDANDTNATNDDNYLLIARCRYSMPIGHERIEKDYYKDRLYIPFHIDEDDDEDEDIKLFIKSLCFRLNLKTKVDTYDLKLVKDQYLSSNWLLKFPTNILVLIPYQWDPQFDLFESINYYTYQYLTKLREEYDNYNEIIDDELCSVIYEWLSW